VSRGVTREEQHDTARSGQPLLAVRRLTKTYPGVVANFEVSLDLQPGEIHAVLGENGAGKTTLMATIYGLHRPDSGQIVVDGQEVELSSPRDALSRGIGYVQQHFSLIPTLTVAENLVLSLRSAGDSVAVAEAPARVRQLSERYGLNVPPNDKVEDLSVGVQQRAELLKALARDARVLILDEPTSVITPQEAEDLSKVLLRLARDGVGIFFISHKLEEVLRIADRVTVLRAGRVVGTLTREEASRGRLAEMMVGQLVPPVVARGRDVPSDRPALEVQGLTAPGDFGRVGVRDVTVSVVAGEVVGIAGVEGSGQVELIEALAGVRPITAGTVRLDGHDVSGLGVRDLQRRGVAHIPADRVRAGFVSTLSVAENLLLPIAGQAPYSRFGLLNRARIEARALELVQEYDIRVAGPWVAAGTLSGGNQQRLVLGREFSRNPVLVLACFATRGLDFASTEAVHRRILEMRARGAAVLYASVELDELLELTDRIVVLYHGRLAGELPTSQATSEELGMLMGGSEA
jgi:ABC-type uncharacterized transport system ATPase subunit